MKNLFSNPAAAYVSLEARSLSDAERQLEEQYDIYSGWEPHFFVDPSGRQYLAVLFNISGHLSGKNREHYEKQCRVSGKTAEIMTPEKLLNSILPERIRRNIALNNTLITISDHEPAIEIFIESGGLALPDYHSISELAAQLFNVDICYLRYRQLANGSTCCVIAGSITGIGSDHWKKVKV